MKLVILDRDGVINEDSDEFIKSPDEFIPIPGSIDAIARLKLAGYSVVIASNQSGLARQLFSLSTLHDIHQKLYDLLQPFGVRLDAIFFCPHGPDDDCHCRKPKPGLLQDIATRFSIDLATVPVVGDALRDIEAARAVGAQPVLVLTGKGRQASRNTLELTGVPVYRNLSHFVDVLLARSQ